MKFLTENITAKLSTIRACVLQDPASWETWKCAHFRIDNHTLTDPDMDETQQLTSLISPHFKGQDSLCFIDKTHGVFIFARMFNLASVDAIFEDIKRLYRENTVSDSHLQLFDLATQAEQFSRICPHNADAPTLTEPHCDADLHHEADVTLADLDDMAAKLSDVLKNNLGERSRRNVPCIMLIEDDAMTRKMVTHAFRNDFQVITAKNAYEGMTNYMLYTPDVVFLDIGLPQCNGYVLLKKLMACDNNAFIVMFSGNSHIENIVDALNIGAKGFVAKPFSKDKIIHYVNRAQKMMAFGALQQA